jgi:hypothetical protein
MEGIIYKYTNKINKKVYIGQTRYEKSRICSHKNPKISDNTLFHNAIRKYGWENFEYKVLFRINCDNVQDLNITLNSKEKVAIKYFNSCNKNYGYNMTLGGDSFIESNHITQELRNKRSIITKTRFSVEENKSYLYKPVVQLDLNGNLIREWKSLKFIVKELGISKSSVRSCCNGQFSSVHNYIFLWKNDYDKFTVNNNLMTEISERLKIIEKYHILQLSKNGNTIKEWNSIPQASSELNISKKLIRDACEGISNEAGGYCWKWKHKKVSYSSKNKKIVQLDLNGNFIKEWDNIKSIQIYFKSNTTVLEVCHNKKHHNTSMGYRWMYKEDYDKILDKSTIDKDIKTKVIRIVQLDLNGNFIREWDSIKEASKETNISDTDISKNCKKYTKRAGTYVWMYEREYYKISPNKERLNINIKDNRLFKNKKIVQLDLNGNFIKEWDNCSVAEKTLTEQSKGGISSCCTGRVKSFHGYRWMFKEDWENGKRD